MSEPSQSKRVLWGAPFINPPPFPPCLGQELPILIHGEPQSVPLGPRGRRPPCKEVGCIRKPPFYKLEDFPPGRPSLTNLGALCAAGRKKPSYGPWNLPQTSFSHLSRQGEALNQLELQFTRCCQLTEDQKLPCTTNEVSVTPAPPPRVHLCVCVPPATLCKGLRSTRVPPKAPAQVCEATGKLCS